MFRSTRRRPRRTPSRPTPFPASLETLVVLHNSPVVAHSAVRDHSRR